MVSLLAMEMTKMIIVDFMVSRDMIFVCLVVTIFQIISSPSRSSQRELTRR